MPPAFKAQEETTVKTPIANLMLLVFALSLSAAGQVKGTLVAGPNAFQLSSTTFANETTLPISMIDNIVVNGFQRLLHRWQPRWRSISRVNVDQCPAAHG